MSLEIFLLLAACGGENSPDVVVVCPRPLREALAPWLEHRRGQGRRIAMIEPASAAETQQVLQRLHAAHPLRAVLLVGDAVRDQDDGPWSESRLTPTHLREAKVNVRWGSEKSLASDNPYADFDGDDLPDVAIGRFPADTPDELKLMVAKTLELEQSRDFGPWRRRVHFVAGVGGFGLVADNVLEMATSKLLTDGIPGEFRSTMTYGSWRSPYCPDPRKFHAETLERLNEGGLFWVYIGHGSRYRLDRVRVPNSSHHILDIRDAARLDAKHGAPIALFLACYTAAFDSPHDCLAEELLKARGGPAATLGGSRVTMPYAMSVLGEALLDETFAQRRATLGEVVLRAKRRLGADSHASGNRALLDGIAKVLSPEPERLADERREHVLLFNLLGDPLLRLPLPDRLPVSGPETAVAGETIALRTVLPTAGKLTAELVARRDRHRHDPPRRWVYRGDADSLDQYAAAYRRANDRRWVRLETLALDGKQSVRLEIPAACRGTVVARLFLESDQRAAIGSTEIYVRGASGAQ